MTSTLLQFPDPFETLSKLPALVVGPLGGVIVTPDGEFEAYRLSELRNMLQGHDFLICNRPVCERHLQADLAKCFDILELFAFIRPAEFCLPLPLGLTVALDLPSIDDNFEDEAAVLIRSAQLLMSELSSANYKYKEGVQATAYTMSAAGWKWGPLILGALKGTEKQQDYQVWAHLSEWEEKAPHPPPGQDRVSEEETKQRLSISFV